MVSTDAVIYSSLCSREAGYLPECGYSVKQRVDGRIHRQNEYCNPGINAACGKNENVKNFFMLSNLGV